MGEGVFGPVRPEVWEFSVSGFQVVQHWLAHRMKKGAGKKSSPLDKIRPAAWQFDEELLDLLWVLEHTVDRGLSWAKHSTRSSQATCSPPKTSQSQRQKNEWPKDICRFSVRLTQMKPALIRMIDGGRLVTCPESAY